MEKLALLGGKPVIEGNIDKEIFRWPIITEEDEAAALNVIRSNNFSGTDITEKFQNEFAEWIGRKYAVAYCTFPAGNPSVSGSKTPLKLCRRRPLFTGGSCRRPRWSALPGLSARQRQKN